MNFSKEELESDYYNIGELYGHFFELNKKTKLLYEELSKYDVDEIKMIDLRFSEIFSLYNTAKLFLSIKGDYHHYEFSSLLNFWNEAYYEMYLVARDNDKNTSWMTSRVENYLSQYEIVEKILKSKLDELKKLLKIDTAD